MTTKELENITAQALDLVKEVAGFIKEQLGQVAAADIADKGVNSLVSYVDRESEKRLVAGLKKISPQAVFLTEEETVDTVVGDLKWIIDPLDGTTNFLHQVPVFAISVGLEYRGTMVAGVVGELMREEYFYAWQGGGAHLNGQRIAVSAADKLFDSCICIGLPPAEGVLYQQTLHLLAEFLPVTRGVRNLGAAAVEAVYVACGRFDAFMEQGLSPWDIAAGVIIVEEAGGKVTDIRGGQDQVYGRSFVASNGRLHQALLDAAGTLPG